MDSLHFGSGGCLSQCPARLTVVLDGLGLAGTAGAACYLHASDQAPEPSSIGSFLFTISGSLPDGRTGPGWIATLLGFVQTCVALRCK